MRFLLTLAILSVTFASVADARGFDVRDLVSLDRVSGPQVFSRWRSAIQMRRSRSA